MRLLGYTQQVTYIIMEVAAIAEIADWVYHTACVHSIFLYIIAYLGTCICEPDTLIWEQHLHDAKVKAPKYNGIVSDGIACLDNLPFVFDKEPVDEVL